jgi:hypothetical protein
MNDPPYVLIDHHTLQPPQHASLALSLSLGLPRICPPHGASTIAPRPPTHAALLHPSLHRYS